MTMTMESDEGPKRNEKKELSSSNSHARNILQPAWFRRLIQDDLGFDEILLAYNWHFLPCLSLPIWCLFLAIR